MSITPRHCTGICCLLLGVLLMNVLCSQPTDHAGNGGSSTEGGNVISGTLISPDSSGGANANVYLIDPSWVPDTLASGEGSAIARIQYSTRTNELGGYAFADVSPGSYRLLAVTTDGTGGVIDSLTKESERALDVGTDTLYKTGAIAGTVTFVDAVQHPEVMVYVRGTYFSSPVDSLGRFHIGSVPPGSYLVHFRCNGCAGALPDVPVTVAAGDTAVVGESPVVHVEFFSGMTEEPETLSVFSATLPVTYRLKVYYGADSTAWTLNGLPLPSTSMRQDGYVTETGVQLVDSVFTSESGHDSLAVKLFYRDTTVSAHWTILYRNAPHGVLPFSIVEARAINSKEALQGGTVWEFAVQHWRGLGDTSLYYWVQLGLLGEPVLSPDPRDTTVPDTIRIPLHESSRSGSVPQWVAGASFTAGDELTFILVPDETWGGTAFRPRTNETFDAYDRLPQIQTEYAVSLTRRYTDVEVFFGPDAVYFDRFRREISTNPNNRVVQRYRLVAQDSVTEIAPSGTALDEPLLLYYARQQLPVEHHWSIPLSEQKGEHVLIGTGGETYRQVGDSTIRGTAPTWLTDSLQRFVSQWPATLAADSDTISCANGFGDANVGRYILGSGRGAFLVCPDEQPNSLVKAFTRLERLLEQSEILGSATPLLRVGMTWNYAAFSGSPYGGMAATGDSIVLEIADSTAQYFVAKEYLIHTADTLAPADTVTYHLTPDNSGLTVKTMDDKSGRLLRDFLPFVDTSTIEIQFNGWLPQRVDGETLFHMLGYTTGHPAASPAEERQTVLVDYRATAVDGPGAGYIYSEQSGLLRRWTYNPWTGTATGWERVPMP